MRSKFIALVGTGLVGVLLLAGCSSSPSSTETSAPPSDKAAPSASADTGLADATFDDLGTTVTSTGFDPTVDGFNFPNWADRGTLDATAMVAFFGQANVCAEPTGPSCTLMPAAAQWLEQANEGISGGHCEGMAVLSQRLFDGDDAATDDQGNALAAYDLAFDAPGLVPTIDYWWATQMTPEVGAWSRSYRETLPSQIVAALMGSMKEGTGFTLGLYGEQGGHAVTPTAVSQRADGTYVISAYDNNYPDTTSYMLIDPASESWLYQGAALNPGEKPEPWTGTGPGTLDLTPMAVRTGPFSAPFVDGTGKGAAKATAKNLLADKRVIMVTGQNDLNSTTQIGARFTIDGKTYDTTVPGTVYPDGVTVQPILGTNVNGVIVVTPAQTAGQWKPWWSDRRAPGSVPPSASTSATAAASSAAPSPTSPTTDPVPVTISVDAPGEPRVTVRQDPAQTPVTLEVNENGGTTFEVPTGENLDVNVSQGFQGLNVPLGEGTSLDVEPGDDGSANLTFGGEDGQEATFTLDGTSDNDRVVDLSGDFDPATGEFSTTQSLVEAQDLDLDFLDPILADQLADRVERGEITQEEAAQELADLGSISNDGSDNGSDNSNDTGSDNSDDTGSAGGGGSGGGGADGGGSDTGGSGGGGADDGGGPDTGGSGGDTGDSGGADAGDGGE